MRDLVDALRQERVILSPLDIKLRADALGKSILFIGYSLTDINIRYLLYKLHIQWAESDWAEILSKRIRRSPG